MVEAQWSRAFGQYGGRVGRCPEALLPAALQKVFDTAGFVLDRRETG